MKRTINISDKLSNEKPIIVIGEGNENVLFVDNSLTNTMRIEEAMQGVGQEGTNEYDNLCKAIEVAVGKEGAEKLNLSAKSSTEFQTIIIAIMAACYDIGFDEAAERFQTKEKQQQSE